MNPSHNGTFRMVVLIVDVLRHRPQQVQLYLLGCRGESQARVVVREQRLVILKYYIDIV